MRTINKSVLIEALTKLIENYENNTAIHKASNCPLCIVYGKSNDCENCINSVFKSKQYNFTPCRQRCLDYSKLNYYVGDTTVISDDNNKNLSEFWREVLGVVESCEGYKNGNMGLNKIKAEVLAIAEKYR